MARVIHDLLRISADAHSEGVAVIDRGRQLTYAELERRSNRLARLLLDVGVSRGDRVGLFLDKSLESLIGVYGILKAGAAYVPLDAQSPLKRLAHIMRNAGLRCLLTGVEKAETWSDVILEGAPLETLVVLNAGDDDLRSAPAQLHMVGPSALAAYEATPPALAARADDLAYILYTSGSTGEPKGVMLSHLNAMSFIDWSVDQFAVTSTDRLSSHAPLHFDLSIFDLFAAGKAGATVVLVPAEVSFFPIEVARFIEQSELSIWYSVPSALTGLVLHGGLKPKQFPRLRTVLFAGEVFPIKYLVRLIELLPDVRFYNLYGPTETNVCTCYEVPPVSHTRLESLPIGKPISNVQAFSIRDDGTLANPGEVGELYVKGPTVMQGYWADRSGTQKALRPLPSAGLVYRTGDLVTQDQHGNYVFLGRRDAQVKRRGYRIELLEIERAVDSHPSVIECAVTAIPDEEVTNKINVHVVTRKAIDESELIRFCLTRIPRYMIPDTVQFVEALPRTSTGKIDRQALVAT
jgi:amino acid adenylation domain-containing protein